MSEPLVLPTIPQCTIAPSAVHGNGLFTQQPIPAEQVLCHLDGQHIAWSDYAKQKGFSGEWNAIDGDILVVRPFRTFYYYINHSRQPNLKVMQSPLRVVALRDIGQGEELLLDYRAKPLPQEYMAMHGSTYL